MPDPEEPEYEPPESRGPPPKHHWWHGFIAPLTEEERKAALSDPGPSWTEFFFWQYLKWIYGLFVLIADALILVSFFHPFDPIGAVLSLAAALYLEYLLWQYLWHRPLLESGHGRRAAREFRPSWYRPFRYGRWTPEAKMIRDGVDLESTGGLDRREFL